jgi:regulator of sigma D
VQIRIKELEKRTAKGNAKGKKKLRAIKNSYRALEAQENQKDAEMNDLKMENEKGAVERAELVRRLEEAGNRGDDRLEAEIKEREIVKLNAALSEIGRQLKVVNDDLASESQCKLRIVELLQQQTQALGYAENQIKDLVQEKAALERQAAVRQVRQVGREERDTFEG